ncbi:MAG: S8 family serine peptidase [Pseudomonadota bacterium]|uniref:S8 family serine peptidase n=1 Tax=Gallaecimonas pentaromativorans TaxID=584787 RepID=UPI00067ECE8A|nr:S8 family serine peptidase [Gallaecimonas pentaromativorans]MED5526049.1 S8 family serine peptidase [Pseudomonadota bacterium]
MNSPFFARLTPLAMVLLAAQATADIRWVPADGNLKIEPHLSANTKAASGSLANTNNRYIIELQGQPLAVYRGGVASLQAVPKDANGRIEVASSAGQAYLQHLQSQQQSLANTLNAQFPGLKVKDRLHILFNGLVVEGNNLDLDRLKAVKGVKRVYRDQVVTVAASEYDDPLNLIGAPSKWQALGGASQAGKGIKVAVIDSGIRPENPLFDDSGFTAPGNLPTDDYCHQVDSSFCNNKLILARYYDAPVGVSANEYTDSPKGYDSHGTHVAGIAVGDPVSLTINGSPVDISGVAPGAYLMVYKAMYMAGDIASGDTYSLLKAMEDAVADGADVINNSWGGGAGQDPALSPYPSVIEAAEAAGVVVVSAAGNAGDGDNTVLCPACSEAGIAVANTQTGRFINTHTLTVAGDDYVAFTGGSETTSLASFDSSALSGTLVSAASIDASNPSACNAFAANAFEGDMVLVEAGSDCSFGIKASNLAAAGAVGMILAKEDDQAPFQPYVAGATFPVAMVSKDEGATLTAALAGGGLAMSIDAASSTANLPQWRDAMATSSSRGPNGNGNVLKPDLAAPGTDIISGGSPDTTKDFTVMSGTSMASPAVAGAAAVLMGEHSSWTAKEIKSALVNSTNSAVHEDDGKTQASPFAMGAGRLDLVKAGNAGLALAPVSLASDNCVVRCSFNVTASNLTGEASNWSATLSFDDSSLSGTIDTGNSDNKSVLALANVAKSFTVTVDTSLAAKDKWYFGSVVLKDNAASHADVHMAIAVYAGTESNAKLLTLTSDQSDALGLGDSATLHLSYTNRDIADTASLEITLPQGLGLEGQPTNTINGGTGQLTYNKLTQMMSVTAILDHASLAFSPAPAFVSDLKSLTSYSSNVPSYDCASECDEGGVILKANGEGDFSFLGKNVTSMDIDFNGYIRFNDASLVADVYASPLPSRFVSGAVLAPFWADLKMTADSHIYYGSITDGTNRYQVIEWSKFALVSDPSQHFSFQALFQVGGDKAFIHYLEMGSLPSDLVVGAQDASAYTGTSFYNDGSGTAPISNAGYQVDHQAPGTLSLALDLAPRPSSTGLTLNENSSATVDLSKRLVTGKLPIMVTSNGISAKASATSLWQVADTTLAANTVTISTQPSHGTLSLGDNGKVTYTPATDYSGNDSFGYRLSDAQGGTSLEGLVSITVTAVSSNDNNTNPNTGTNTDTGANNAQNGGGGGGGGAFGILALLMAPLMWMRRRKA